MGKSVLQLAFEKEKVRTVEFMDHTPGRVSCLGVEVQHRGTTLGHVMAIAAVHAPDIKILERASLYDLGVDVTGDSNIIGIIYFPGEDYGS